MRLFRFMTLVQLMQFLSLVQLLTLIPLPTIIQFLTFIQFLQESLQHSRLASPFPKQPSSFILMSLHHYCRTIESQSPLLNRLAQQFSNLIDDLIKPLQSLISRHHFKISTRTHRILPSVDLIIEVSPTPERKMREQCKSS